MDENKHFPQTETEKKALTESAQFSTDIRRPTLRPDPHRPDQPDRRTDFDLDRDLLPKQTWAEN